MLLILQLIHAASIRINNTAKQGNFSNNGARLMQFSLYDGGENGELISVGLGEISELIIQCWKNFYWTKISLAIEAPVSGRRVAERKMEEIFIGSAL